MFIWTIRDVIGLSALGLLFFGYLFCVLAEKFIEWKRVRRVKKKSQEGGNG